MRTRISSLPLFAVVVGAVTLSFFAAPKAVAEPEPGAIRVLFLGHESEHHNSNKYYPMLAKALGRDAIYFDYVTSVEEALGDVDAARDVLEDGLSSCPRAANIWREFVQFEGRHRGEDAAEAARRRARAALGG